MSMLIYVQMVFQIDTKSKHTIYQYLTGVCTHGEKYFHVICSKYQEYLAQHVHRERFFYLS